MIQEMNNIRANDAYNCVTEIKKTNDSKLKKEFRTLARSFPSMVQGNGLGAAAAFLYAKKSNEKAHRKMYDILQSRLVPLTTLNGKEGLMDILKECNSDEYRLYTREVMAYMQWVKRFAEGMLKVDEQVSEKL